MPKKFTFLLDPISEVSTETSPTDSDLDQSINNLRINTELIYETQDRIRDSERVGATIKTDIAETEHVIRVLEASIHVLETSIHGIIPHCVDPIVAANEYVDTGKLEEPIVDTGELEEPIVDTGEPVIVVEPIIDAIMPDSFIPEFENLFSYCACSCPSNSESDETDESNDTVIHDSSNQWKF